MGCASSFAVEVRLNATTGAFPTALPVGLVGLVSDADFEAAIAGATALVSPSGEVRAALAREVAALRSGGATPDQAFMERKQQFDRDHTASMAAIKTYLAGLTCKPSPGQWKLRERIVEGDTAQMEDTGPGNKVHYIAIPLPKPA